MVTFNNKNDVWVYINDLVNESKQRGSKFNILQDIYEQLPFFVCFNIILDQNYQEDISMYMYCSETGVPPYKGAYGQQPKLWIQKYYVIKNAIEIRNQMLKEKEKR